jgi:predicted transcriptional regulator
LKVSSYRRDGLQIIAEILSSCIRPQKKTHIMYEANLSFQQLKSYLNKVQEKGLLELRHSEGRYVITGKGLQFLQKWLDMRQMVSEESDYSLIRNPILIKILKRYLRP